MIFQKKTTKAADSFVRTPGRKSEGTFRIPAKSNGFSPFSSVPFSLSAFIKNERFFRFSCFSLFSHLSTRKPISWKTHRIFTISRCFLWRRQCIFQAGCVLPKGIFRLSTVFTFFHLKADFVENSPYIHGFYRAPRIFPSILQGFCRVSVRPAGSSSSGLLLILCLFRGRLTAGKGRSAR